MVRWVIGLALLASVAFGPFAAPECAQIAFNMQPDGTVTFGTHQYKSLADYFSSDEFRLRGGRCGTAPPDIAQEKASAYAPAATSDCSFSQTAIRNEYWPDNVLVIPIVFHIIQSTTGEGNISDSRIYNQVQALNEDYRARTGTLGGAGFDSHVQFELAGITRVTNEKWFVDANYSKEGEYKSELGWDQARYLNVYVNSGSGNLGRAYLPQSNAGDVLDGVQMTYMACGGRDEGELELYNQGRTLTHEVGHYLGLFHTFEGGCGIGYRAGDLIDDTNPESVAHFDCTVQQNTCEAPDPLNNYMNYTDDICMQEFTSEQANRAVCALLNYRQGLYHIGRGKTEKKIFVRKIPMKLRTSLDGKAFAKGVVVVKDQNGRPVPKAFVSVRWSGVVNGTDFKRTNDRGRAIFKSSTTGQTGTFTLNVTNVYRAPKRYVPARNNVTSASISN